MVFPEIFSSFAVFLLFWAEYDTRAKSKTTDSHPTNWNGVNINSPATRLLLFVSIQKIHQMDFDILFEMVEHFKHFITVFNQCGGGGVVVVVVAAARAHHK